jgi:O-antigen ligase
MNFLLRDKNYPLTRRSYLLMWALVFITLGFWKTGTDPINIPKLLLLGAFSGLVLGNLIVEKLYQENKLLLFLASFFLVGLTVPLVFSSAPLVQQVYGVSGRNTGFLAYLFLLILFISAATLPRESDYQSFPRAILIAGYGSVFVCTLEIFGLNPLGVNNPFGAIIGTLGNPNFVSAFSAMIAVGAFALSFNSELALGKRIVFLALTMLSVLMVLQSNSFQGFGATFLGLFVVLLFLLFYKRAWFFFLGLLSLGTIAGVVIILGLFEKGPLASSIYQYTLPIRIEYWQAGLRMFFGHPLTGIGLNSYGDWYRFTRDSDALIAPGGNVTTDVAHNVYIDFAAGGGLLALISFALLFGLTGFYVTKALRKLKKFDPLFISSLGVWLVYLMTAFFSIDNLGLAIWGWVFGGALIGMSKHKIKVPELLIDKNKKNLRSERLNLTEKSATDALIPQLLLCLTFLGIVTPAFKGDLDYANAIRVAKVNVLVEQIVTWPQDQARISNTLSLLLSNGFGREGLPVTLEALRMFPRSSVLWYRLYENPSASKIQRNEARERLRELDPLNPTVLDLKKI